MSNCALLFWTSQYFSEIFVSVGVTIKTGYEPITKDWTKIDFLKAIIYVEHILIIFQIFLRQVVDDKPEFVIAGERDRDSLVKKYEHDKEHEEDTIYNGPDKYGLCTNDSKEAIDHAFDLEEDKIDHSDRKL